MINNIHKWLVIRLALVWLVLSLVIGSLVQYVGRTRLDDHVIKIGYEISFTRHFYKPQPLRTLEEIAADILAIEKEAEGLLDELIKGGR